ncbi:hypothetical protein [Thalassospira sp. UBA1131]|uniref:hypothetical protein n=1 Tax=Thalassospira sp. UBA1131 TaxID=1947672 RepID=UPI0025D7F00D|nr:hypothetical protein [Thalassospira sp. UBA1131]
MTLLMVHHQRIGKPVPDLPGSARNCDFSRLDDVRVTRGNSFPSHDRGRHSFSPPSGVPDVVLSNASNPPRFGAHTDKGRQRFLFFVIGGISVFWISTMCSGVTMHEASKKMCEPSKTPNKGISEK